MLNISLNKCRSLSKSGLFRSISNFVEIKGKGEIYAFHCHYNIDNELELPKHVTQDMIMNKINEYGSIIGSK